jgi:hypothetical protein
MSLIHTLLAVLCYTSQMADLRKFYADVQRIQKHTRAKYSSHNPSEVTAQLMDLFNSYTKGLGDLPHSILEYWKKNYIDVSSSPKTEPVQEHIDWLAVVLSFIDGELEDDQDIPLKDWKELADLINYEAEDIPIDMLSSMMTILVEKKAL